MAKSSALLRASTPFIAFATLVAMLDYCTRLANASGHVAEELWSTHPPVISNLGMFYPEHLWFASGFTVIAALVGVAMATRINTLGTDPHVARSRALRRWNRASVGVGALSIVAMLVMGWVPYRPPGGVHFFASLSTFLFLAVYEFIHGGMCLALTKHRRPDDPTTPGPLLSLWFLVCPIAAMTCVYVRVTTLSVPAQYASVILQFAYFMPMAPLLAGERREAKAAADGSEEPMVLSSRGDVPVLR